ncbi:hypothetical protein [Pedobacter alpinus]|uniref:Outer membrane protein beta-barrel domain-containing protein n=1 Tax=Pedobacter alpinus TaxID=1590643 RepID=A0ABW5TVE9_9SPHI
MKKLIILTAFMFLMVGAKAQDDQLYFGLYRMSSADVTLKTGNASFKANNLIFKIDWLAGNTAWVGGDFSLVPNIDWGGTVEAKETIHGAWAEVDFGWYVNPKKPIKILGSETHIGLGFIGGFKSAGFSTAGITFPGASLSALTYLNDKIVINTKYHYSFFFNNTESEYTARNIKLAFDCTYRVVINWV